MGSDGSVRSVAAADLHSHLRGPTNTEAPMAVEVRVAANAAFTLRSIVPRTRLIFKLCDTATCEQSRRASRGYHSSRAALRAATRSQEFRPIPVARVVTLPRIPIIPRVPGVAVESDKTVISIVRSHRHLPVRTSRRNRNRLSR